MNERGFSAIEVLLASAISAIIAISVGMGSFQIVTGTQRNTDWTTATRQAQGLGHWISRDAMMVYTIGIGDDDGTPEIEFITLSRKDWESGDTYDTSYVWFDSDDSLQGLNRRQVKRDLDGVLISDTTTLVADNIYTATLTAQTDSWLLHVVTKSGNRTETRDYEIVRRLQE